MDFQSGKFCDSGALVKCIIHLRYTTEMSDKAKVLCVIFKVLPLREHSRVM
jgi:hypothetical protein